jgi:hypothetical protein
MSKTYLRKRQLAQRYGDVTLRSIERAVEAGRLPRPEFPCGEHTPLWDLEKLEANERAAARRKPSHLVSKTRLLSSKGSSTSVASIGL